MRRNVSDFEEHSENDAPAYLEKSLQPNRQYNSYLVFTIVVISTILQCYFIFKICTYYHYILQSKLSGPWYTPIRHPHFLVPKALARLLLENQLYTVLNIRKELRPRYKKQRNCSNISQLNNKNIIISVHLKDNKNMSVIKGFCHFLLSN